ncbi:NAD(P)/FAD-dependent oxidoreductase [Mucilaginibacter ginsenosidivorans]|uniref:NADH:ubiquinone reductase (non-electrogenic) n=1 Tax=Mucilaginibacter ginsenosidivorans TaxID=398053 RepID=A0A5B8UTY1_9SPHI|nr:NAD(P)/FAD-dependent oxidoreductase [Mucilaginibacter ginsenosidivorans]QEC62338.1 NAD(P)/FAD-dependent oxidoreductase [Mucilaginibacter ginsenosidivorans]
MDIPPIHGDQKRVVIVGAGFAGLTLAKKLSPVCFQIILIDRNNYHQFQPLLYQVATSGLEPSSISFPLRKIFQHYKNIFVRIAEVKHIHENLIETSIGNIEYDFLVLAHGAETNYFKNQSLQYNALSMKSVGDAIYLRNTLLQNFEQALNTSSEKERRALLQIIIVGGGPTGVELAGAIAEMKNNILPKDYPELDFSQMQVILIEAFPRLLSGISEQSGQKAQQYLESLGVIVKNNLSVKNYDGYRVELNNGDTMHSRCLVWAAGVKGMPIAGLPLSAVLPNNRIRVDEYNRVHDMVNVFALGDVAFMQSKESPKGHPQVAPVAIQQARLLAMNLKKSLSGEKMAAFRYKDNGSMATVGRNLAVVEIGKLKISGACAWFIWMLVHLMSIIGVKNKLFILINWLWQYVTYDQSLRLILKTSGKNENPLHEKNIDPAINLYTQ